MVKEAITRFHSFLPPSYVVKAALTILFSISTGLSGVPYLLFASSLLILPPGDSMEPEDEANNPKEKTLV